MEKNIAIFCAGLFIGLMLATIVLAGGMFGLKTDYNTSFEEGYKAGYEDAKAEFAANQSQTSNPILKALIHNKPLEVKIVD